ncbi:FAD/NAD(P)-binding domain-containing protein [Mytilinidion resinicola]|uniref:FAD/NAD(P)-binding domain-containing protein n=1 Tax=Mytilinidion resinicola TaxID=574789 RepID=A0A6A6YSB3_9PEZI|nr:FAD/NAD(P)-binding domain-containing protein [Mytilinidion resinicola]KAF2811399.1 FAD/NAD(P)-binding domain-containing protein [Mytilinidion resinicola]
MSPKLPIIILGGGIVGLTLAQALRKALIPFQIYERDPSLATSDGGWGITVHWALAALESCLPPDLFARLKDIQVDPQQGIKDTGRFLFLDLATAEPRYVIPPSKRMRISRKKLRALLTEGLEEEIHWGKKFTSFETMEDEVVVKFEDGTEVRGSLLVGADGSGSRTRRALLGAEEAKLYQLPVRFMGVTVRMTPEEVRPLRDIDPLLFQGCHPDTGAYLWFAMLSTPEVNGSSGGGEYYEGQLNLSWLVKSAEDEVPVTARARVAKMKQMAQPFEKRLKKVVDGIPDDSEVLEIKLQDWPTKKWDNRSGTVTLVGDAAHAMTMYRGEAFNHGITDAARLSERLAEADLNGGSFEDAVNTYEEELRERTNPAVLWSRQACLDAHDLNNLKPDSPLVSRRTILKK